MARIVASGILLALAVTMNACALALPAEIAERGGASGGHPHEAGGGARTALGGGPTGGAMCNEIHAPEGGGRARAHLSGTRQDRTPRLITNM